MRAIARLSLVVAAGLAGIAGATIARADCAAPRDWQRYVDDEFGAALEIPFDCFAPLPPSQSEDAHLFQSADGRIRLAVRTRLNTEGFGPESLKRWLVDEVGGYGEVTYAPRGRTWLVLSGYRDDDIYYEKYMFSRRGQLMSGFWLAFPRELKPIVAPIIERMEDSFRPG